MVIHPKFKFGGRMGGRESEEREGRGWEEEGEERE